MRRTHVVSTLTSLFDELTRISYPCATAISSKLWISSGKKGLVMFSTMMPNKRLRPLTRLRACVLGK
jgi:hypothetical protein